MSDHSGLRCMFDQLNLNARKDRLLIIISEFDFEIRYIKGKENELSYALRIRVHVNHIETMSSYGRNLQDQIL